MGELFDKLTEYMSKGVYPFHMPGHKRRMVWTENPYEYDITEIPGFDYLHSPTGILANLNKRFEEFYGDGKIFFTVNGSTVGILAGVSSVIDKDDTILIARNCHKSVYNAAFIRKAKIDFIFPKIDSELGISLEIKASDVENSFEKNPNIKAVVITSPTYEGIISDIESIANVVHKYGAILIVDGAHGAHLGIVNGQAITEQGADIVVMSLHKTLPAPTQTSVVWVRDDLSLIRQVDKYINIYETSSPSYLLMCGGEKCLEYVKQKGVIVRYNDLICDFRSKVSNMEKLFLYVPKCEYDIGKIVIGTTRASINGEELKNLLLEKYQLELEMASENYALAMSTVADSKEGLDRLLNALMEIDRDLVRITPKICQNMYFPNKQLEIYEADKMQNKHTFLSEASGKVSGGYVYAYPPGIPWLVPGEIISEEIVEQIIRYISLGIDVRGVYGGDKILTIER